jgi:hypothetical protein
MVMKVNKGISKWAAIVGALAMLMGSAGVALAAKANPNNIKVPICHKGTDKTVPLKAAFEGHRKHGDTLGTCEQGHCACQFIYLPVECSNGVTYANECDAACDGATDCHLVPPFNGAVCVDGSSPACQLIYLPVECSDGVEYANQCVATCLGGTNCTEVPHGGTCVDGSPGACQLIYLPVVCSDGVEYANQCVATCVGGKDCVPAVTCVDGSPAACPFIFLPVTCSNGQEYANLCVATCAGGTGCSNTCACDATFVPVVCENGQEYANQCEANCAAISDPTATNCVGCTPGVDCPE